MAITKKLAHLSSMTLQCKRYNDLYKVLEKDVQEAGLHNQQFNDSQFGRRAFIRTLFALVEGSVFSYKQLALKIYKGGEVNFTSAEFAFLQEEQYYLSNKGNATARQTFQNLAANLRFSFQVLANVCK